MNQEIQLVEPNLITLAPQEAAEAVRLLAALSRAVPLRLPDSTFLHARTLVMSREEVLTTYEIPGWLRTRRSSGGEGMLFESATPVGHPRLLQAPKLPMTISPRTGHGPSFLAA